MVGARLIEGIPSDATEARKLAEVSECQIRIPLDRKRANAAILNAV